jgi:hypothetical protein
VVVVIRSVLNLPPFWMKLLGIILLTHGKDCYFFLLVVFAFLVDVVVGGHWFHH